MILSKPWIMPKPWWLRAAATLGILAEYRWITIFPIIYHPADRLPEAYPAIVAHEEVHLCQQSTCILWRWVWRYLTNAAFRLQMEVEGIAAEVLASPAGWREGIIQNYSAALAGTEYRHAAKSTQEAERAIRAAIAAYPAR